MKPGDYQERPTAVAGDTFRILVPNGDGTSSRLTVRGACSDVVHAVRSELFRTSMDTPAIVRLCDDLEARIAAGGSFTVASTRGLVTVDRSKRATS